MVYNTETEEFVKHEVVEASENGEAIGFMVYQAGKHLRALEFTQGCPRLGGKGNNATGRKGAGNISEKQKRKNKRKTRNRRGRDLMDTVNTNEGRWLSFDTFSYAEVVRDPDVLLHDFDVFKKFVTRKIRERYGLLFDFAYTGTYGFQDGKRNKDKKGRFSLHGHMVNNLPYWEAWVIVAENPTRDKNGQKGQYYLQNDGTWKRMHERDTFYFDGGITKEEHKTARNEAGRSLNEHREALRESLKQQGLSGKRLRVKRLPFYSIAWGKGHYHRRWFKKVQKKARKWGQNHEDMPGVGGYMAGNYMLKDEDLSALTEEEIAKFAGKKSLFHSDFRTDKDGNEKHPGGLERVGKLYNREAKQFLVDHDAWECLTKGGSFEIRNDDDEDQHGEPSEETAFEIGHVVEYLFNLHAKQYPTITTIPLEERDSLFEHEEVRWMFLAIDEEIKRREREREQQRIAELVGREEPSPIQEEFWGFSDGYRMAYGLRA